MVSALLLDEDQLRRLARYIADELRGDPPSRLLTACELASQLGVSRDYVYQHADELGAVRVGDGAKPRLRFPADSVPRRTRTEHATGDKPIRQRQKRQVATGAVLAIRGTTLNNIDTDSRK